MPRADSTLLAVRVWDLPTRLFHWALALAVVGAITTAKIGGDAIDWHFRCGYLICTLVVFRLLWGLVGGRWSRFANLVHAPGTIWRYLRGRVRSDEHLDVGHNPLGSLSVLALLSVLVLQVGTGLLADDEIASAGPLVRFVTQASSSAATSWHRTAGQWGLIGLIGLHLAAIILHQLKGRDLLRPMLSGDKWLPAAIQASDDSGRARWFALVLLALCTAAVSWVVNLSE